MDGFQIVGGDNATECEVNRTKSQLRRTNALGRGPANAHVDQLSARRLLRLPLIFLYLLLSANVTLWIPLSSVAVDDVRELLLVLWLLYLVSVSIARSFVERVRASTAKHVG